MHEPAVTLTDYGLALECAILGWRLAATGQLAARLRVPFVVFFAAAGCASLFGGTVHGFIPDESATAYGLLWPSTLLSIGVAAVAAWWIGLRIRPPRHASLKGAVLVVAYGGYAAVVILVSADYLVAIIGYLPAAFFLLGVWLGEYRRSRARRAAIGTSGILLSFAAAGVQQAGFDPTPWFDHNALYHLLQGVALYLLYRAGRGYATSARTRPQSRLRSASSRG